MNAYLRRLIFDRFGLWLALALVLCVIVWRGWVVAQKPAHAREIADEIGSTWHFPNALYPNHSNSRLVFDQFTETGIGLFFCDTAGGKIKLLCEQPEKGWSWQNFGLLGWSPDDNLFACAFPPDPKQPLEEIIIYNGETGEVVAKLEASIFLSELAWLTPHSFAYSFRDWDNYDVAVIEQKPDGNWIQAQIFKKVGNKEMTGLVATSSHSIAWRQGASLCALDFASAVPEKIWESATNQLVDFTFAMDSKEFLLNCSDDRGQFLIRFYPQTKWTADAGRISDQPGNSIQNVTWFKNGARYACLGHEHDQNVFYIKANTNSELVHLLWQGGVNKFILNGERLFISGNLTNLPPGVWEYDLNSAGLSFIGSSLESHFQYASIVVPVGGVFTNASGQQRNYYVSRPVHFSPARKYPVIISQTIGSGTGPYSQIPANEGYYSVMVSRPGWWEGLDSWKEDIVDMYDILAKTPNIDTSHVFLSGSSAETPYLSQLIVEKPDLWKGVILLSPSVLPDLFNVRISSMFIVAGADDGNSLERLTQYQDQAADAGISVKLLFLGDAGHLTLSLASERKQLEQFAEYLSEN